MSGNYYLNINCEADFDLDGDVKVPGTEKPMVLGKGTDKEHPLAMTKQQFYEKKEQLRERLITDSKRLGSSSSLSSYC